MPDSAPQGATSPVCRRLAAPSMSQRVAVALACGHPRCHAAGAGGLPAKPGRGHGRLVRPASDPAVGHGVADRCHLAHRSAPILALRAGAGEGVVSSGLGDGAFAWARAEGRSMTPGQTGAYALDEPSPA